MNQREGRHDQRIYIKHVLLQKGFGMSVMGTHKGGSPIRLLTRATGAAKADSDSKSAQRPNAF